MTEALGYRRRMMGAHRELLKTAAVDRVNEDGRVGLDLPQTCLDGDFPMDAAET